MARLTGSLAHSSAAQTPYGACWAGHGVSHGRASRKIASQDVSDNASRTVQALRPVAKVAGTLLRVGEGHSQFELVCKVSVVHKVKVEHQQSAHYCEERPPTQEAAISSRGAARKKIKLSAPSPFTRLAHPLPTHRWRRAAALDWTRCSSGQELGSSRASCGGVGLHLQNAPPAELRCFLRSSLPPTLG